MKINLPQSKLLLIILTVVIINSGCGEDDDSCDLPSSIKDFALIENAANGTLVGNVSVNSAANNEVSYSITSGNDGNTFQINNLGEIKVLDNTLIDFEEREFFELEISISAEGCTPGIIRAFVNLLNAQDELYADQFFSNISKSDLIPYGPDTDFQVMYVYQPVGGTQAPRPVLVFAGGGTFIPSNLDILDNMARRFAGAGYVVALTRYISDPNNEIDPFERFVTAVQDVKAAIRFFRKDQANENIYNINPENIFIGGHGTGGFIALQAAYARENDLTPEQLELINSYGGFEGERGNPGYSSQVNGVMNLAGAIYDLNFIDDSEPPISCIHNIDDPEVNCDEGLEGTVLAYGSCRIISHAQTIGLPNQFSLLPGNSHSEPVFCTNCHDNTLRFFLKFIE